MTSELKTLLLPVENLPADALQVRVSAPVNIAVIKYWGKRDTKLILPTNSSLSFTLHQASLRSETRIIASKTFEQDSFTLNGKQIDISASARWSNVFATVRAHAQPVVIGQSQGSISVSREQWPQYKLLIDSVNNFPTAAGLASSASGLAALAVALSAMYRIDSVPPPFPGWLTTVARQGSGSACRSIYGGCVEWKEGEKKDGTDSVAVQRFSAEHWPELRVVIVVVNAGQKKVGSTPGMQRTVATSQLFSQRLKGVPDKLRNIKVAIEAKDFDTFGRITMQDSSNFHACCLDTYPPVTYLNDTSHRIISLVHAFNATSNLSNTQSSEIHAEKDHKSGADVETAIRAAYTFDAGPNAVLFTLASDLDSLVSLLHVYFPDSSIDDELQLLTEEEGGNTAHSKATSKATTACVEALCGPAVPEDRRVSRLIVTSIGGPPSVLEHTS